MIVVEASELQPGDVIFGPSHGEGWSDTGIVVQQAYTVGTFTKIVWEEDIPYSTVPTTTTFTITRP